MDKLYKLFLKPFVMWIEHSKSVLTIWSTMLKQYMEDDWRADKVDGHNVYDFMGEKWYKKYLNRINENQRMKDGKESRGDENNS